MNLSQDLSKDTITRRNEFENRIRKSTNYTPEEQQTIINSLYNLWENRAELGGVNYGAWDELHYSKIIDIFDNIYTGYVAPIVLYGSLSDYNGHSYNIDMIKIQQQPDVVFNKSRLFHSFILGIPSKILAKQEQIPDYSAIEGDTKYNIESSGKHGLPYMFRKYHFGDECKCLSGLVIGEYLGSGKDTSTFACTYEGKECVVKFTNYNTDPAQKEFKMIIDILTTVKTEEFIPKLYTACICKNKHNGELTAVSITQKIKYTKSEVLSNYAAKTLIPLIMDLSKEITEELISPYINNMYNWYNIVQQKILANRQILINKYNKYCVDILHNAGNTMYMDDLETGLNSPDFTAYLVDLGMCINNQSYLESISGNIIVPIDFWYAFYVWNTNNGSQYANNTLSNEPYAERLSTISKIFYNR